MNTDDKKEFDYQTYMKKHSPNLKNIHRGTGSRKQRFEEAAMADRVRIDEDILEQFRQLIPQGQGYEKVINHALREWLSAKTVKELLREELTQMVQQAFASVQPVSHLTK